MRYSLLIAIRYIFTKRSFHFITVISVISLCGIVTGVAALISVISIFNGFRDFTEKQLIGFDPHLRITVEKSSWIGNSDKLLTKINNIKGVKSAEPLIQGRTLAINGNNMQVFTLNSVNPEKLKSISDISKKTIMGSFYIGRANNLQSIVLGAGVADRLKVLPGDTISLISPYLIESSIKSFRLNSPIKTIVTGIFQTNAKDFDNIYAYTNDNTGKELFDVPFNSVSTIDIKIHNINDLEQIKHTLIAIIPANLIVRTWYELHKQLYEIMDFERMLTFIIMSLIIIIAVFNVLASLTMTVVEKKQDIGVLKAMGASDKDIRNIFVFQGAIIGLISTILGNILGLGFCYGQIKYGWFRLDGVNFLISSIPVTVRTLDVIIISMLSMILSILASIYPSRRAAKTVIINSIHSE